MARRRDDLERRLVSTTPASWLEDRVKATKTLSLPTVYIQGDMDGVNPPAVSETVAETFTGRFERVVLPGVGHFPTREAPAEVARILLDPFGTL